MESRSNSPTMIMEEESTHCIRVRGARTNNLKSVDVDIPRNQLVVITGVSGSGKTSLAFDTIFSEGRRQFIEGQSVYTRQFINQLPKADVELIDGLQPTLAIHQRAGTDNPRSTVATITEIYDFLRVLMARCGDVHCHRCGQAIQQQTVDQICDRLMELPERTKIMVMSPLIRGRKGQHAAALERIRNERLVRVRIDGQIYDIEQPPNLDAGQPHTIEAVTDRIIIREGIESRLVESLELAVRLSEGLVSVAMLDPDTTDWTDQIYSTQYACSDCGIDYAEVEPRTFSFNSPYGACSQCDGLGTVEGFDPGRVLHPQRSLQDGAVECWNDLPEKARRSKLDELSPLLALAGVEPGMLVSNWTQRQRNHVWNGCTDQPLGILQQIQKEYSTATDEDWREYLERFRDQLACPHCHGSRLCEQANSVTLAGKAVAEITSLTIENATEFFQSIDFDDYRSEIAAPLVEQISHRLKYLEKVGVGYLSLDRTGRSLSGGEHQRVRLASAIGTGLTCVCFVLDEPSIGLHQRDNDRLIQTILELKECGNSLIVVEHDEEMMRVADCLIDVGPGAGKHGGQVIAAGTPQQVMENPDSLTGKYLSGSQSIDPPQTRRDGAEEWLRLSGATGHNLKGVELKIPLSRFTCITGVSGSGKSTLLNRTLSPAIREQLGLTYNSAAPFDSLEGAESIERLVQVDQTALGRSSRGCAATYTGVMDELRKIFSKTKEARQRGYRASRFSFNSKSGHCAECQGHGQRKVKMSFLPDMFVDCPSCHGKRFNTQTLQIRFRGLTIADVLELPIEQALSEFQNIEKVRRVLQCLVDVGLGYLALGQPSSTLSGGEAQRVKLATELARPTAGSSLYLMDEPTTGLHFEDIRKLMQVVFQLVDQGNTVIVIEHNLDVIKCADWIIDLGPEGGDAGGMIVAEGTPESVAQVPESHTGRYLAAMMGSD